MTEKRIVIIDTGCSNISSVKFAINRLGYNVSVSRCHQTLLLADKLFLPGVGTASHAMKNLQKIGLIEVIQSIKQPLLGICLGMQLLGESSQENHNNIKLVDCLQLCTGETQLMEVATLPLPHMGWNRVSCLVPNPLFKGIENAYFYFVHSYAMPLGEYTIAQCDYNHPFTAALKQDHFYGVQFHPERSSEQGAILLNNFIQL